ncbi:MAG: hypothetical protein ACN4GW_01205 [Desulforhopalus sp.]
MGRLILRPMKNAVKSPITTAAVAMTAEDAERFLLELKNRQNEESSALVT